MPETVKSRNAAGYALTSRLSLATKLYSVFALVALLTAAITLLSDYNSRRNAELIDAGRQHRFAQRGHRRDQQDRDIGAVGVDRADLCRGNAFA
jgi:hypothetical protein